ncbi:zinc finger CCCH-type antiviral protein 1-like [Lithobates pipiens]
MSDPAVTAYLTKLLCSHGGRLERNQLGELLGLPVEQIEQILQDEVLRFPQSSQIVLAQSPLRICARYLLPNDPDGEKEEEEKCPRLHLCRRYLKGQCRYHCRFSHDVFSDHNRAVLKANGLSGLSEDEIKVLLLQNDNQLLPEDCSNYKQGSCDKGDDCTRLHMCRFFTRGACNYRFCKKSHNLLASKIILTCGWLNQTTVQNFQMLCVLKHNERQQLQEEINCEEARKAQRPARGKGRGRGRPRRGKKDGSQDLLKGKNRERKFDGPCLPFQSTSHPSSQCSNGQLFGDEDNDDSSSDSDHGTHSEKSDNNIKKPCHTTRQCMELGEMASSLLPGPGNVFPGHSSISKTSLYSTGEISYAAQPKQVSVSGRSLNPTEAGASKVQAAPSSKLVTSPMRASPKAETSIGTYNASTKTSATSNITEKLSTKSSSIPDQKQIIEFVKRTSSSVTGPSIVFLTSSPTLQTSPIRENLYTAQPKPVTSTVTVQRNSPSSPSNPPSSSSASIRTDAPSNKPYANVELMTKLNRPSGNQYTIISSENKAFNLPPKSTNATASQPLSATTSPLPAPNKASVDKAPEICLSNIWKFCRLGGCCSKMHYYLPYRWQEFNRTDWEDLPNMECIEKAYCDPNMLRYQSVDFKTMKAGNRHVRRLTTPSSVTSPSEYVLTTEWIWYWKDEFGTWTKYGQMNIKKVSSSICSSDLETVYLSDPTGIIRFTAGGQDYIINCQEMRQRNVYYKTEKEVCRRPKFLDFEKVKMLKGSTKSAADNLIQNPLLKTVNYPPHWCMKSLSEVGYQKVLVPENSGEFSNIVKMFTTTVSGHVVKKLWRVQNPSLWQVYLWQKDQMKKKKNSGINVDERQLFHGTDGANVEAICRDNFDWRVCGTNGTAYGQGSYFARNASYSHNYSVPTPAGTRTMFLAHVLVGDFVVGDSKMRRPPQKYNKTESYDSCVDNTHAPSIFVVFEKFQVYPEYILEYEEEKKSTCVIS